MRVVDQDEELSKDYDVIFEGEQSKVKSMISEISRQLGKDEVKVIP